MFKCDRVLKETYARLITGIAQKRTLIIFLFASFMTWHNQANADDGVMDNQVSAVVVRADSLAEKNEKLDAARQQNLFPHQAASSYDLDLKALEDLPQGTNTPIDKVLLQTPGVSYDSAISNPDFHIRNEYANVQYRINGILLPEGVSALGSVLDTGFIGNLTLLDGALPAQYGLRTAGVVDLTTKNAFDRGGNFDLYGGSQATISPRLEYGGSDGDTQYFLTGRYLTSQEGLENAIPATNPIHDRTTQEKIFGYGSTLIGDSSRLSYLAGGFFGHFQIPDVEGAAPLGDFGPQDLSSTQINEKETDQFYFGLLAFQSHKETIDTQISAFTRYASTHFIPDVDNDLAFNDVASNVARKSLLGGIQFDAADHLNPMHVLRFGFLVNVEQTRVDDLATVLPLDVNGNVLTHPVTINDETTKTGWNLGGYIQDEWTLRTDLSLNIGLRFDQMRQFVSANQFSPRIALLYKPFANTTIHMGISRYFTPPMQAQATPPKLALFQNTTQQPEIPLNDLVRPERANYYDIGFDQTLTHSLTIGADTYYKRSTDTLDDGQFGQATVLQQYNYAHGFSQGVEFKTAYTQDGLRLYANLSVEVTKAKTVVSNQYLIGDPVELAYLASHYTYASDAQTISASFGSSYQFYGFLVSVDGLYGSGLRSGFANEQHTPGYTQWNAAISRQFEFWPNKAPTKLKLSVINLFDSGYLLRSGSGIGEFAPQYGPRQGIFLEMTQSFR